MTPLAALWEQGQSPWLDNLRRDWIENGELQRWIDSGIRGLTSNPSIFQKAISGSADYDTQFRSLIAEGHDVTSAYWQLVTSDIKAALAILRPVYDSSDGTDGFVSVEVDPSLAHETEGTTAAARALHESIDEPNLMVKIPGTEAGLGSIEQMIAERRSINVTLIFSVDRYRDVMEAYVSGLERAEGDLSKVSSVASFFISRVDTEIDNRLGAMGSNEAAALRGTGAIAQARAAYAVFLDTFSGARWDALRARGAQVQRPLWASTSTKNPSYPDTLYVDELIGPDSVNTMPDNTIGSFIDHGTAERTIDADPDGAALTLKQIAAAGVDIDDVAVQLEREGVASFIAAFDDLIVTLTEKAATL